MVQPTKPYTLPSMPPKPAKADELTLVGYGVKRERLDVRRLRRSEDLGCLRHHERQARGREGCRCGSTASSPQAACGRRSRSRAKTGAKHITWDFKVARLPVTEKKVEYEASRQSFKPARVTCDIDGTELVPLGDPNAITCWVAQTDNTSVAYHGGLDDSGVITFTLAAVPTPAPTPTVTPSVSSTTSPTPSAR